jgi:hypothetical protein
MNYETGYRDAKSNKPPRTGATQEYLRGYENGRRSLYQR